MEDDAAPVTVSYGRRSSFVLADDLHDYFGSQRSIDGPFCYSHIHVQLAVDCTATCLLLRTLLHT